MPRKRSPDLPYEERKRTEEAEREVECSRLTQGDNYSPTVIKSGEVFTETYSLDEDITAEPTIHISQEAFTLCEADFLRLKSGAPKLAAWATKILIASLGMLLSPLAKFLQTRLTGTSVAIGAWEWVAPCIGLVIALIIYLISKCLPNERKQVMKDIETHFSIAPRIRHLGERRE